ncbi:Rne/Rng family ribonuclease [Nocardioides panacisoli]
MADDQNVNADAPQATTPDSGDGAAADKPAPRKKAPAKKAAAKKAASKPRTAKKAAAAPADTPESAGEAASPAEDAPKKAAPRKRAPAKKAAAKKAPADTQVDAPTAEPAEDASGPATLPLFQAPEKTAPRKRASKAAATPDAEPAEEQTEEQAEQKAPTRTKAKSGNRPAKGAKAESADGAGKAGSKTGSKADEKTEAPEPAAEGDARTDDEDTEAGEGGTSASGRRRRRRGGRRRRKPGESGEDAQDSDDEGPEDEAEKTDDGDSEGSDAEGGGGSSSSRRRRRRRREGDSGDGGGDDPHNTVTRVRKPRSAEDEITAVAGSTRLEAKKQRRREGREAGRRRAPIVSEAEFLARRESVERVMVVRQRDELTQIGVLEDKVLVEHYVARESQTSLIGNVYLGRVQNVLPSMEAAFIDIGKGRNAVLYAGEVNWSALGHKEGSPRKIESVLQSGQTILVQVTKDPIGHKGARLTSQVSLAGRFLVYVPDGTTSGISRKLPDTERARLKTLLKEIVPESAGVIVRTAAEGASEDELTRDVERLKARWTDIEAKAAKGNGPQLLYGEPDLTLKVVRDLFTEDFAKLVVQGDDAWETVHDYVEHVAPDLAGRLEHYKTDGEDGRTRPDLFAAYRIDEQIAKGLDRKVWLPSGGSLIIDRTEAMTVIDVNTGKFTGSGGNLEETVTKNNLEAAEEIVRQLRLRDIGGIIVVDFIDMVLESNRDLVLRRLVECLGRDRTRHQVAEVTSLGLVQMTRKRIGTGLLEAFSENCPHCQGRGVIVHELPVEPRRGGGGGDEEPRRGRRRRGKGQGDQGDEGQAAKPVPSPKDVAAMAKPPAPEDEDAEDDGQEVDAQDVDERDVDEQVAEAPAVAAEAAPEPLEPAAVEAKAGEPAAAEPEPEPEAAEPEAAEPEAVEPEAADSEAAEPEAAEPEEAPAPPAPPTVVTRTRRRAASRPAGPPAAAAAAEPTVGAIGSPPVDGAIEPGIGDVDPAGAVSPEVHAEEPHVEHVPIKKKGARKR